ncbi:HEAT repeat protein [Symmachiella macrocystis]|uniref:HEAT repeat protein n=1 Tax=Symmachiella macrocystis TaxID=2527985 RepID=A0A5C6BKZ6_9PLAN|nr:HEAT repeat domain-containing protein [Symmachiella macrocystis]TWU12016.1 HEAT repeat protein [Symmachiella macrocystis]
MRCLIIFALLLSLFVATPSYGQEPDLAELIQLEKWLTDLSGASQERRQAKENLQGILDSYPPSMTPVLFTPNIRSVIREYRRQAEPLIPQLIEMLDSDDVEDVNIALGVLTITGPDAKAAIPKLKAMLFDKKTHDAEIPPFGIFVTLLYITPADEAVMPLALQWLDGLPKEKRDRLVGDLQENEERPVNLPNFPSRNSMLVWTYGFLSEIIIPHLLAAGHTRVEVPSLLQATDKKYPLIVRSTALSILMTLQSEASAALPGLRKHLADSDPSIRYLTAIAILAIEQDAAAIPQIAGVLNLPPDERKEFETGAAKIVASGALRLKEVLDVHDVPPELMEGISGMLTHGNATHRRLGLIYLAEIGPAAKSVIPAIEKLRNDPDEETRRLVLKAMHAIKPQ